MGWHRRIAEAITERGEAGEAKPEEKPNASGINRKTV